MRITIYSICSMCKEVCQTEGIGTGYATTKTGKRVCYDCAVKIDREELENLPIGGKIIMYLVKEGDKYYISNWPGTFKIRIWTIKKGNHNIAGTRSDVWFCYAGHSFHGVQYGACSQICHITRVRD